MGIWQYTNDELREELWRRGKGTTSSDYREKLDLIDEKKLREIIELFHKSNWTQREKIYKKIIR